MFAMIRLARKPSLWTNFFGRLLFAIVWAGGFVVLSFFAWRHRAHTSLFVWIILGFFDLLAIGVIWDIVVRFWRTLNQREPVVEIDRDSLAYGDSAQVKVTEPSPRSIAEMGVKLIGECYSRADLDVSEHRETVISLTRCFEEELMRLKPQSDDPISRIVEIHLPKSPPADKMTWKIVVDSRLKQGGIIEHPFPLRVRDIA
jgi:hypothetical protein